MRRTGRMGVMSTRATPMGMRDWAGAEPRDWARKRERTERRRRRRRLMRGRIGN
jgi:hypothetical protein